MDNFNQKAVIFDLDGTLLDTLNDIADCINAMLNEFGYQPITVKRVRDIIGSGATKLIADALPERVSDEKFIKCIETYNRIYNASGSPKTKLFDGINEVACELKNRGYKLAVLSNKPQLSTDKVREKYLSEIPFDLVVGQSDKIPCKPDPKGALYILEKFGVSSENAYLVGDGETDVLTAINANVKGVAVLWGNRSKEQLIKAGASVFANTPSDLLNIFS